MPSKNVRKKETAFFTCSKILLIFQKVSNLSFPKREDLKAYNPVGPYTLLLSNYIDPERPHYGFFHSSSVYGPSW